jgi:hypothetical protein
MHRTKDSTAATQLAGATAAAALLADPPGDHRWSVLAPDGKPSADARAPEHSGLPVARLRSPARETKAHYVVTSVDLHGRLGDRSPVRLMGWEPGHPVAVTLAAGVVMIASRPGAREAVTGHGHLRLPAPVRRACRLQPGDRLLVAAHPDADLLVAYTPSALDQMILAYHCTNGPGGT